MKPILWKDFRSPNAGKDPNRPSLFSQSGGPQKPISGVASAGSLCEQMCHLLSSPTILNASVHECLCTLQETQFPRRVKTESLVKGLLTKV